jgi:pyruvate dehydrogenase E2 component (dihydrolipoamide acetyltransferase)
MPSLGADMQYGRLVAWRVRPGQKIARGEIIAEVETDKGLFEVEAFTAGIVDQILLQPGAERIPVGTPMATITAEATAPTAAASAASDSGERRKISPAARRRAAELDLDLASIQASGPHGVINLGDVERAAGAGAAQQPCTEPAQPKTVADFQEGMRQAIAAAMSRSNRDIPHYYLATDIDMSHALNWLAEQNRGRSIKQRILPVVLPLKAVALALEKVPELHGHWLDGRLQRKTSIDIGFAINLRQGGLITPALFDVNRKSLDQLMAAMSDLITRCRAGRLRGSEITEAGITVTSLGDLGVQSVFGVIYPPQVALVGLGRISERPWAEHGLLGVRPVLTATLAADHRASDGHLGAQFLDAVNRLLQKPEEL